MFLSDGMKIWLPSLKYLFLNYLDVFCVINPECYELWHRSQLSWWGSPYTWVSVCKSSLNSFSGSVYHRHWMNDPHSQLWSWIIELVLSPDFWWLNSNLSSHCSDQQSAKGKIQVEFWFEQINCGLRRAYLVKAYTETHSSWKINLTVKLLWVFESHCLYFCW